MPPPRKPEKKAPVRKGDYMAEPIQKLAYKLGLVDNPSAKDVRDKAYAGGTRSVEAKKEDKKDGPAQAGKAQKKKQVLTADTPVAQAKKAEPRDPPSSVADAMIRSAEVQADAFGYGRAKKPEQKAPEAKKVQRDPRDVAPRPAAGNVRDRAAMDAMAAREAKKKADDKPATPVYSRDAKLNRPKGNVPNGVVLADGPKGRRAPWTMKEAKAAETARAARTAMNTEDARELPKADGRPAFKNDVYKLKIVEKGKKEAAPPKPKAKPEKPKMTVEAAKKAKGFKEEFAAARASGREVFDWNGKKYNTRVKGEKKSTNLANMKKKRTATRDKILNR